MYHNEVAQDFLEVKILADRNHIELPEGYNERLAKMIEFCVEHKKPDGIEMAMGDSDDIDVRDIITKAAYSFNNPQWKAAGYTEFDFDCVFDLGVEAAAAYAAMPALPAGGLPFSRTAVIFSGTAAIPKIKPGCISPMEFMAADMRMKTNCMSICFIAVRILSATAAG